VATPATKRWDGTASLETNGDSGGPYVDHVYGPGSLSFFAFGAHTGLTPDEWAAKELRDLAGWHGCPATAEATIDISIGGAVAQFRSLHCQGRFVQKATVVRNGYGWTFTELDDPGSEAADRDAFTQLLALVAFAP
jgi:hypothetical protein